MKYTYLLALAGVAVAASTGFSQNLVTNPSFEAPAESAGTHTYYQGGFTSNPQPTGWTTVSSGGIYSIINGSFGENGSQYIEDFSLPGAGYSGAGSLYEATGTSFAAGTTYNLSALADLTAGSQSGGFFYLASSTAPTVPLTGETVTITGTTPGTFKSFSVPSYTATGLEGGTIVVGFTDPSQAAQGNLGIDNFVLTAVPEPSSIAIAALGGFGLLGLVRRRRA